MKKVTATITTENGERKKVTVYLDNQTAKLLLENGDQALIEAYVTEEYYSRNLERRERDHCTSLDAILDEGHDFEDKNTDTFRVVLRNEREARIRAALSSLTEAQRKVVISRVVYEMKFQKIAEEMGLSKITVWEIYQAAEKKLKNFLKTP